MVQLKVAIVHDWIKAYGGSEQLLLSFKKIIGSFDLFTTIYNSKGFPYFVNDEDVEVFFSKFQTSLQKSRIFPSEIFSSILAPLTFESYDLSKYDLVISNSHSFSHGVITNINKKHIVYYNTPMRYIWSNAKDYDSIVKRKFRLFSSVINLYTSYLRIWDCSVSCRADHVVSISQTVQERVKKYYKRDSQVIYPPVIAVDLVNNKQEKITQNNDGYYITVGRLVPNKNLEVLIKCFNDLLPDRSLVIVGEGSEKRRLKKIANSNIKFTGFVNEREKYKLLRKAKGFVFCADEDFGIAPMEALALGVPVVAYNRGGIREHLFSGRNGVFFDALNEHSIFDAIIRFESVKFDSDEINKTVSGLSEIRFIKEWNNYIESVS